jgi:ribonuclease HI
MNEQQPINVYTDGSFGMVKASDDIPTFMGGWACKIGETYYCESGIVPYSISAELEGLLLALRMAPSAAPLTIHMDHHGLITDLERYSDPYSIPTKYPKFKSKSDKLRFHLIRSIIHARSITFVLTKSKGDNDHFNKTDRLSKRARWKKLNYVDKTSQRLTILKKDLIFSES